LEDLVTAVPCDAALHVDADQLGEDEKARGEADRRTDHTGVPDVGDTQSAPDDEVNPAAEAAL
jgi:hypothetical protein